MTLVGLVITQAANRLHVDIILEVQPSWHTKVRVALFVARVGLLCGSLIEFSRLNIGWDVVTHQLLLMRPRKSLQSITSQFSLLIVLRHEYEVT